MTILVTGVEGTRRAALGRKLASRLGLAFDGHGVPVLRNSLHVHLGDSPLSSPPSFQLSAELGDAEIVERVARAEVRKSARRGRVRAQAQDASRPLEPDVTEALLQQLLDDLGRLKRVLLLPPDHTRAHSGAGELTSALYRMLAPSAEVSVLPALGTHEPMTAEQLGRMFPGVPLERFLVHDFRERVATLGEVPGSYVEHVSAGKLKYPIPCQVSLAIQRGDWDRIISIGQLVPHEVSGIANHAKNVFVGTGGKASIDRSHFLGAVCGMESMMGRAHTPVRDVLNYMSAQLASELPITYLCTVRKKNAAGVIQTHGLYAGDDEGCFLAGAPLVQQLNLDLLDAPLDKVVVYLDPHEFRTTWLGNKALYRTRMAIADGGELVILGPAVRRFGEDPDIDRLIRRHGYRGTPDTLRRVEEDAELARSLSAAAHLIHGASEGRFRVRWAAGGLTRQEIEAVGYEWADVDALLRRYSPKQLADGRNRMPDGEEIFFVSNPGLGLWALRDKFSS